MPALMSILAPLTLATLALPSASLPRAAPRLTSGTVFPGVTVAPVCRPGDARSVHTVPAAATDSVSRRDGIRHQAHGAYAVDHQCATCIAAAVPPQPCHRSRATADA